jgi:hypothetical protein
MHVLPEFGAQADPFSHPVIETSTKVEETRDVIPETQGIAAGQEGIELVRRPKK